MAVSVTVKIHAHGTGIIQSVWRLGCALDDGLSVCVRGGGHSDKKYLLL
jgi:hypothetical protein